MKSDQTSKSRQSRRILNGLAWTLLFAASILAVSGFDTDMNDHLVMLLIFLIFVFASTSIPLFWFGGYNRERCVSRKIPMSVATAFTMRHPSYIQRSRVLGYASSVVSLPPLSRKELKSKTESS